MQNFKTIRLAPMGLKELYNWSCRSQNKYDYITTKVKQGC